MDFEPSILRTIHHEVKQQNNQNTLIMLLQVLLKGNKLVKLLEILFE